MNRTLRFSSNSYQSLLRNNSQHQFAMKQALRIYRANAIYSFIPKNACSTLRLSLAIANGCLAEAEDFNWIHQNNDTFSCDLASLATASYTFVVLRCPFSRIASAYLDKIVGHTVEAWQMYDSIKRVSEIGTISFDFFVRELTRPTFRNCNPHWRPQVDFLVYAEYDDYFCLESFTHATDTLKEKIGLQVVDARDLTNHGLGTLTQIGDIGEFSETSAMDILAMKYSKQSPSPKSLFTEELIELTRNNYKQDIDLYKSLFGSEALMF